MRLPLHLRIQLIFYINVLETTFEDAVEVATENAINVMLDSFPLFSLNMLLRMCLSVITSKPEYVIEVVPEQYYDNSREFN